MATYTCKFCGTQKSQPNFSNINGGNCAKSPHGKHEMMNATERLPQYTCKYCGHHKSSPDFTNINGGNCSQSPHGKHELLG